jgi:hypothetical protein
MKPASLEPYPSSSAPCHLVIMAASADVGEVTRKEKTVIIDTSNREVSG